MTASSASAFRIHRVVTSFYHNQACRVKSGKHVPQEYKQCSGMQQGCPFSAYLFVLFQAVVLKDAHVYVNSFIGNGRVPHFSETELPHPDDTVLLANSSRVTTLLLKTVRAELAKYNVKLNPESVCVCVRN